MVGVIINSEALRLPFADASVDAALCSPPYWGGLRAYAGDQDREWQAISYGPMPGLTPVAIPAQRVALGHEPDPFSFCGHLLLVFREVRRVLRKGGCLAVNLGDCYSTGAYFAYGRGSKSIHGGEYNLGEANSGKTRQPLKGMASKNLLLMPWRFALAMQSDGWVLRSRMPGGAEVMPWQEVGIEPDITWRKKSCMPESVRDRPTVDFEDVLLFSQGRRYFFDQEAGREDYESNAKDGAHAGGFNGQAAMKPRGTNGDAASRFYGAGGRNMRSVWTINPEPTDEEHFAAWPVQLAARLIRVMTSEKGVCPECGAPWVREVNRALFDRANDRKYVVGQRNPGGMVPGSNTRGMPNGKPKTTGWRSPCAHDADPVPATVLDPFAGLGRTWEACRETGRRFIGTDLGLGYCCLALSRNDVAAMDRRRAAESKAPEDWGPLFAES